MAELGSENTTTSDAPSATDGSFPLDSVYKIGMLVTGLVVALLVPLITWRYKKWKQRQLKELQSVQEKLQDGYKHLSIAKGSAGSETPLAGIPELWVELDLYKDNEKDEIKEIPLQDGALNVRDPGKVLLPSWTDLLNPKKVKELMIILVGGAGFGKTTLLKNIAHTWSPLTLFKTIAHTLLRSNNQLANFKLVFFIDMKEMNKMNTRSIIDAIKEGCIPSGEVPDNLPKLIIDNQQETLFLLDGFDELNEELFKDSNEEFKEDYSVRKLLQKKVFPKSRVIISTRHHKKHDIIKCFPKSLTVETFGFKTENTQEFINNYFNDKTEKASELNVIMATTFKHLSHIPLICRIVCNIYEVDESHLSAHLTELYRRFTEFLAKRRCQDSWERPLEKALKDLGLVGWEGLLDDRQLQLTQEDFDNCQSVLQEDYEGSGLVYPNRYETGGNPVVTVTFIHRSFQEYSAAYYFAHLYEENKDEFKKRLNEINTGNLLRLELLLQFACGILKKSKATGLILEHVQKQQTVEVHDESNCWHKAPQSGKEKSYFMMQSLARTLLHESGSEDYADIDQQTYAKVGARSADLVCLQYYVGIIPEPLRCEVLSSLRCVALYGTNLHKKVKSLKALIHPSLYSFTAHVNELTDDDALDLIKIIPKDHGLLYLDFSGNYWRYDALDKLSYHIWGLPNIKRFSYGTKGDSEGRIKKMVSQNQQKRRILRQLNQLGPGGDISIYLGN